MEHPIVAPRKLIETSLPLDAINAACVREKSIRHGHPSTLHLYWARRPLAAARAVLFAQLVNDPAWKYKPEELKFPLLGTIHQQRKRLFDLIEELVIWENINNESVLKRAREEIRKSWMETCETNKTHPLANELFNPDKLPAFHDPFAGGGAIPLEAQRLGLEAWASDLNPVAVLINKAMIEIPPKFAGSAPVGPAISNKKQMEMAEDWSGARGLAEDVRRYGYWMREEAFKQIGHLYPKIDITKEMAATRKDLKQYIGQKLTVIAWIWVRTVKSPNPQYSNVSVPLASTFILSSKKGKEAWIEPIIDKTTYRFEIRVGAPKNFEKVNSGTKLSKGAKFECIFSGSLIESKYVYSEANKGEMGSRLMAIVAEGVRGRVYLEPSAEMERVANQAKPKWKPDINMPKNARWFSPPLYGLKTYGDLFTSRQLVALNTFSDLVNEVREKIKIDALSIGVSDDGKGLDAGGLGATAYAEAVSIYLGFGVDKCSDYWSAICSWHQSGEKMRNTFGRQAIPMVWDYTEANPFCSSTGNWMAMIDWTWKALLQFPAKYSGTAVQADAQSQVISNNKIISTDPPYYDNIGYADLSDFFYIWQKQSLKNIFPKLLATVAVPKAEELIATPYRHGSKEKAETFFLDGMTKAMHQLSTLANQTIPITIYYAFKQSETRNASTSSTGWETFLSAILKSGLSLVGTWPMRTELSNRMVGSGTNALASSVVLVCRPLSVNATVITRGELLRELQSELPKRLEEMLFGSGEKQPIHPADLAQAAIGPGMAIFSKYKQVIRQSGEPVSVREALEMINAEVDRYFEEGTGEMDRDSRFCLKWYSMYGFKDGPFGEADGLARAKGSSVQGVVNAGALESGKGKVRLLTWEEYPEDWDPDKDSRIPAWELLHHMVRLLNQKGSEAAGRVLGKVSRLERPVRQLAYQLYTLAERAKRADEALHYNKLVTSWEDLSKHAKGSAEQISLGL